MNIDKLPDECLLYIFNLFNTFGTLLNCAAVCERWKYLVLERLHNVKYLTDSLEKDAYPASYTMFFKDDQLERLEQLKWFPRLKILDVVRLLDNDFISSVTVKGLQFICDYYIDLEDITCRNPSLEMLAIKQFSSFFANEIQGPIMKQLFITSCTVSEFASCARYFPNLKRLHIERYARSSIDDEFYDGPVLEKLEILEIVFYLDLYGELKHYHGFSLADQCPRLRSAFHYIQTDQYFHVNSGIKNHFLEDLVLQFNERQDWSVLRRILSKYPNLKHLAVRGGEAISDENIPELLELLPRIILIDIRYPRHKVTEKSTEYIDRYCKRHNRSISFYYQKRSKLTKKWPHLSTKSVRIGRGFDFMKYCFLRNHNDLPILLDPDE